MTHDIGTIAGRYAFAVDSYLDLIGSLDEDEWAAPVPCLPGWDVRDVLSHAAGVPDDALAGRMAGAPGEAWTASQVERNRLLDRSELIARFVEQAATFGPLLDSAGEGRPPFDLHSHEHDVRHALGRAGNRDNALIEYVGAGAAAGFRLPFAVRVEFTDGRTFDSPGSDPERGSVTLRGMSPFEIFRSRTGRRSRQQLRDADWSGAPDDIDALLDEWFMFGPSTAPIEE